MRFTFLVFFGLLFLGLNNINAQSCCQKASTAATNVSEKKCCMDQSTASTAATAKVPASKAQMATGVAAFVSGGTVKNNAKSCDPSNCIPANCDLSKCDQSNGAKTSAAKASTTKVVAKSNKSTAAL